MLERQPRVLVVDDDMWIHRVVEARLRADGYIVTGLENGSKVLEVAKRQQPDVILLDVDLPDISGFEVCEQLKSDSSTMLVPVIFLTGLVRTEDKVRGLDLGAVDYILKPFDSVELRARVRSAARTKYLLDLLEQKAQIDGLTGLYNRACFDQRLGEELERCRRYGMPVSLIMADVDRFKLINDDFGHYFGDIILTQVSQVFRSVARASDLVARYGGEEFIAFLPEQDVSDAAVVADRIRTHIESLNLHHSGRQVQVTCSLGCASSTGVRELSREKLITVADQAMYAAKQRGRNRVFFWDGYTNVEYKPVNSTQD